MRGWASRRHSSGSGQDTGKSTGLIACILLVLAGWQGAGCRLLFCGREIVVMAAVVIDYHKAGYVK